MQILIIRVFHFYGVVISAAAAVTAVLMELYAMQLGIKFTWQHVFATAIAYSAAVNVVAVAAATKNKMIK